MVILTVAEGLSSMKSQLKHEVTLEAAAAGITRVAQAIVGIPAKPRQNSLGAVERSYRKIATTRRRLHQFSCRSSIESTRSG
jgi:hypothetical protein